MKEEDIIKVILNEAFYIHTSIGPGMLENVYKSCMAHRLRNKGFHIEIEKPVPVYFEEIKMDCGYRSDIIVEGLVVIETKSVDAISPLHIAQVLTYLQFLKLKYGLILNFNVLKMKDGIRRVLRGF